MSAPTGPTISIQFDAVAALADELSTLAAELSEDGALCRSAAPRLHAALGGDEGWSALSAATAWAALAEVVGARSGAVAGSLVTAVAAYRAAEEALARRIGADGRDPQAGGG
jgi:hypothetical protein